MRDQADIMYKPGMILIFRNQQTGEKIRISRGYLRPPQKWTEDNRIRTGTELYVTSFSGGIILGLSPICIKADMCPLF